MITVREAARRLGVSEGLVYAWARSGELPSYRFGRRRKRGAVRVREEDLEVFVLKRRAAAGQEAPPNPDPGAGPMPPRAGALPLSLED